MDGAFRIHLKMQLGRLIVLIFQNLPKLMSFAVGRDETNPAWIILTSNGWNLVDIFPPSSLIGSVRRWMPGFLVSNKLRINDFANTVLEDMEEIGHDS